MVGPSGYCTWPSNAFESRLGARLGAGYLTADLLGPHVMERMDMTKISYPDETFDVIYCSHVLEHVEDDMQAMREFHRVLKRSGLGCAPHADHARQDARRSDPGAARGISVPNARNAYAFRVRLVGAGPRGCQCR